MKKIILLASCYLSLTLAYAQGLPKEFISVGFSYGQIQKYKLMSMPIIFSHQIAGMPNIRYTLGVRQNLGFGQQQFTINKQTTNIDDLSNYSVNFLAGLEYISTFKLLAGFNIDIIGGTIGTRSYKTVGVDPVYSISPEGLNLLKGGSNDQGSLNSEFYIGYRFNDNVTVKAGFSHYLTTLMYANINSNGTIQKFINVPFFQLQYVLWQN